MRIAIVSDLHANLQAWNAVLLDIRSSQVDRILCLGDLVGYGPNPAEVLESAHAHVDYLVMGNHDAAVCGKLDESLFNDNAARIIRWTRDRLSRAASRFLADLPLCLEGEQFRCAHGDFEAPGLFRYVSEPEDARPSWSAVQDRLLFVGHTHQPRLFVLGASGTPRGVAAQDFEMEDDKRFLVNVGSVGQPRDGEVRACYCLYDVEARAVFFRRIPFDLDAYRAALASAGLPEAASYFLQHDPRQAVPPLREMTSFRPPSSAAQGVRDAVLVQRVELLERSVRRWRGLLWSGLAAALLAAGAAAALAWRHGHRGRLVADPARPTVEAAFRERATNLLPAPGVSTAAGGLAGWDVRYGNRYRQAVRVEEEGGEPVLVLESDTAKDELDVVSATVLVDSGMRLGIGARFQKSADFEGEVELRVSLLKAKEGKESVDSSFIVKQPNQPRQGGWQEAEATREVPAAGRSVRLHVAGRFKGMVRIRGITLQRK